MSSIHNAVYQHAGDQFTSIDNLTTNDFLRARWKHWLAETDTYVTNTVTETISLEREPSPNGATAGQLTWYDYVGKTNVNYIGTQNQPLFVARILPGGTSLLPLSIRQLRWPLVTLLWSTPKYSHLGASTAPPHVPDHQHSGKSKSWRGVRGESLTGMNYRDR